ncbi:MAG: hypothetical protein ABI855_03080 [Bacteroidota bacterium]
MAKKIVDFVIILQDRIRKRHYHETEKGKVIYYVVQLETKINNKWKPVIRYDCAHGFSHLDKYNLNGRQYKTNLDLSFENALKLADWDINENREKYINSFLKSG